MLKVKKEAVLLEKTELAFENEGVLYDRLEEHNVNLNQGAESTVSYLLSRLIIQK